MKFINDTSFGGERAEFAASDTTYENVKFLIGESALKQARNITARNCDFYGKYPFWHNDNATIENCLFTVGGRAAIWYSNNVRMVDTMVEAPKMFREIKGLYLENTKLTSAAECCWNCRDIQIRNVEVKNGDYIFMNGRNIDIDGFKLQGNYSFQDAKDVVIRNAVLDSKDAFWNTENVTVYDSVINGEYLGWHSKNLRLVNCRISGTQALCYATNLVMENCTMEDTDLCFEYSTVNAVINSNVDSIKNPAGGVITVHNVGEIIIDENCINPGACKINTNQQTVA